VSSVVFTGIYRASGKPASTVRCAVIYKLPAYFLFFSLQLPGLKGTQIDEGPGENKCASGVLRRSMSKNPCFALRGAALFGERTYCTFMPHASVIGADTICVCIAWMENSHNSKIMT